MIQINNIEIKAGETLTLLGVIYVHDLKAWLKGKFLFEDGPSMSPTAEIRNGLLRGMLQEIEDAEKEAW